MKYKTVRLLGKEINGYLGGEIVNISLIKKGIKGENLYDVTILINNNPPIETR